MVASDNKRIAKNTFFLYIRMLLVMVVALFTSRVVLSALGIEDFGIYNVVGGISSAFLFFSAALSTSTQRYLNFELGKNNLIGVNQVFNLSLLIYSVIAIAVLIIGLTFGRWFVEYKLVIPESQRDNALIVLYCTVISLSSIFVFSVYESVLIARENMKLYAYIGIIDVILKLCVAYIIVLVPNRIVFYSLLMVFVQIIPKLIMVFYCINKYPEIEHKFYFNHKLFKDIFGFTGWNIYGSAIWMINGQGINILLNLFFGPIVNAANGIAQQVNSAITNFGNNFFTAVRPQIVKRYSSGELDSLLTLIFSSTRFSIYLLWMLSLPIIVRASQILHIWLVQVPEYTNIFVKWVLIYSIINSLNNPIWTALMATGKIKRTVIIGSNLFLLSFPLSYLALKFGSSPIIVFPILSLGRILFLITAFLFLRREIDLSILKYLRLVIIPIIMVCSISYLCSYFITHIFQYNIIGLIIFCFLSVISTSIIIFFIGITRTERFFVINIVKKSSK